jgi:hypothetical protein
LVSAVRDEWSRLQYGMSFVVKAFQFGHKFGLGASLCKLDCPRREHDS